MNKFGPKTEDHFSIGKDCPACHKPFKQGDYTTLIALGPGDDEEAQKKARTGRAYTAVGSEIHWECSAQQDKGSHDT